MNSRLSGQQLQGLISHGEQLVDHIEDRSAGLQRLTASGFNMLLGACLGMLVAYGLHLQRPPVDFNIVGPLLGGAGAALARLVGHDRHAHKRQERLRLEKLEAASRLQMASQIVDFLRSQGRILPQDVQDGAWAEVSRLVSNRRPNRSGKAPAMLAGVLPQLEKADA